MRIAFITIIFFIKLSAHSQFAESFNFSGLNPYSGTYFEPDPMGGGSYVASEKFLEYQTITVLSKIDNLGGTIWHSIIYHPTNLYSVKNSIGDLNITGNRIYLSVYLNAESAPLTDTASLNIYKFDLNGNLLDSLVIQMPNGMYDFRSGMTVNSIGNLITTYKSSSNDVIFCQIDTSDMTMSNSLSLGTGGSPYANQERTSFVFSHHNLSIIAFNQQDDTLKFFEIDPITNIIYDNFNILLGNRVVTWIELGNDFSYTLLVNQDMNVFTPAENPLRIIKINSNGGILYNQVYNTQNPWRFICLATDTNGDIYVGNRCGTGTLDGGGLIKIVDSSIFYEFALSRTNVTDIDIIGNSVVLAGDHVDNILDGKTPAQGNAIVKYKKASVPNFEVVSTQTVFTVNDIKSMISYNSSNYIDFVNASWLDGYLVKGIFSPIGNSSLCISGTNVNGEMLASYSIYNPNVFEAGPITDSVSFDLVEEDQWNRVWKITSSEIDVHILAFQNNDVNYVMPEVIKNWPAHGDVLIGQASHLARYRDLNQNNIYEPQLGEYPLVIGDYCVVSIYNDINGDLFENCVAKDNRIGIQVIEYAYGFLCDIDSALQTSMFVRYEIVSHNLDTLFDVHVGNSFQIGMPVSSRISSDPARGIFYGRGSSPVFPGEQAYMIIASTSDPDGTDNLTGIGINETPNGQGYGNGIIDDERLGMTNFIVGDNSCWPMHNVVEYSNFMRSKWSDGSPLYFGGDGYNIGTTSTITNFHFTDSSDTFLYATNGIDPGFYWSEESAGIPAGDRFCIASSGPFTLAYLDTLIFDIALITGLEATSNDSHLSLLSKVDSIKQYFIMDSLPCGQNFNFYDPFEGTNPYLTIDEKNDLINPILFPNPTTGFVTLKGLPDNSTIFVYKLDGALIAQHLLNNNKMTYDYSDLSPGIYFIKIESENYSGTLKFVKQ